MAIQIVHSLRENTRRSKWDRISHEKVTRALRKAGGVQFLSVRARICSCYLPWRSQEEGKKICNLIIRKKKKEKSGYDLNYDSGCIQTEIGEGVLELTLEKLSKCRTLMFDQRVRFLLLHPGKCPSGAGMFALSIAAGWVKLSSLSKSSSALLSAAIMFGFSPAISKMVLIKKEQSHYTCLETSSPDISGEPVQKGPGSI